MYTFPTVYIIIPFIIGSGSIALTQLYIFVDYATINGFYTAQLIANKLISAGVDFLFKKEYLEHL